jgi:beta-galactosidase
MEIVDKNGVRCPYATNNIQILVEGVGELIGLDSGNQNSHERYKTNNRNAYEGRILATIKPTKAGIVKVLAVSGELIKGVKTINVVN